MELGFFKLDPAAQIPTRAHEGDAGLDLRALEAARLGPGERIAVRTGLAVAIPPGHAGLVLPRSGLAMRHGVTLTNSPGLIDSGYRGELKILMLNTDPAETFMIGPGDRIAQLVIVAVALPWAVELDSLDETERGSGGFGSSGRT
jgi:dUTP pyrophosphatase